MTEPFRVRVRRAFLRYVRNIFVAFDQFIHAVAGGDPDWTISAWLGFCVKKSPCRPCKWICVNVCAVLELFDRRHCHSSLEADPGEGANDVWNILLGPNSRWAWALRLGLLAAILLFGAGIVFAHGEYDWIRKGNYTNPESRSHEHCCGLDDCVKLDWSEVEQRGTNWLIKATGEVIPFEITYQSEDQFFWRCHTPAGDRRCFFAPGAAG